jgi:hypothetical protein
MSALQDGVKRHKDTRRTGRQRYVSGISAGALHRDLYGIPIKSLPPSSRIHTTRIARCRGPITRSIPMMDLVMLALAFVFFAVSIAYVYACERL